MASSAGNGISNAQTPITIKILKTLEPITLLSAISLFPVIPAVILTAASGALVPSATMVSPMTVDGTFNFTYAISSRTCHFKTRSSH